MKKKVIHFVQCALAKILFFGAVYPLQAQVSNPSSWESFVNSNENRLVSDTFRLQTFGKSEWDNWEYTVSGNASIVDNASALKLPVGSSTVFTPYSLSKYNNAEMHTYIRAQNLTSKKKLIFQTFRAGKTESIIVPLDSLLQNGYQVNHITKSPSLLTIQTGQPDNPETCSFILDSVYATGKIPAYSLFSGIGNWNDTILWSHLPPLRHRSALIKGDASITTDTYCKNVAINSGSLKINPVTRFILKNLDLYESDASLYSEGAILLSDRITFHKTFEESGKWYFISFPFDVYPSGIDPRFEQKDATPNDGGNYFYVQSYNGDKRASDNQSTGNWEVMPVRPDNVPLFEKNKGYLIALDEKATIRTLSFSSQPDDIPEDFANAGVITIPLGTNMTSGNQENYGWYLCGNPLPAPLVLSQIEKNIALDGNIYVYDGNGYKTYSLSSNYALPPFAAFFVKASSQTELKVSSDSTPTKATSIIRTNFPVNKSIAEPYSDKQSTGIKSPVAEDFHFFIKDGQLHLQNIPEAGYVRIINMMGRCVVQKKIQQGAQVIPIVNVSGMYILQIHSANYQKHHKVVLP